MYSEKKQFEKIMSAFDSYIKQNDTIDVLWSVKNGCVYMNGIEKNKYIADSKTWVNINPSELYELLLNEVIMDVVSEMGANQELYDMTQEEKQHIKDKIACYTTLFPEYAGEAGRLFILPEKVRKTLFQYEPVNAQDIPFYVDLREIREYAEKKGVSIADLPWDEKERFLQRRK